MTCAPPFSLSSIAKRLFTTNIKHIICTLGKKTNACVAPPLVTINLVRKIIALVHQSCPFFFVLMLARRCSHKQRWQLRFYTPMNHTRQQPVCPLPPRLEPA